jgi:hypothetical protein
MLVKSGHDSCFMNFSDNGDRDVGTAQEDTWNETEKVVEDIKYDNIAQQQCTVGVAHNAHIIQETKNTTYRTI